MQVEIKNGWFIRVYNSDSDIWVGAFNTIDEAKNQRKKIINDYVFHITRKNYVEFNGKIFPLLNEAFKDIVI